MIIFEYIILTAMIVCSIAASCTKNLLSSVIIFMTYSLMACIIWVCLRSPDLAVTEAAVGAGVSSTLFFVTLKNVNKLTEEGEDEDDE
ncbi:MAG: hydrogenase subunit MbhD domain-containing protein [Oscillospiraceae bacterium]|nr:hydrogenase subunit MbhD domain-containing protein [Oscillospiraceae bacterium]MDY4586129.1 hydrogenase subunit MbhD domain-containing protein [Oscillospiraceae bacterium]